MEVLTLEQLQEDRQHFKDLLEQAQDSLHQLRQQEADTQNAILRFHGVIVYLEDNIKAIEDSHVAKAREAEIAKQEAKEV